MLLLACRSFVSLSDKRRRSPLAPCAQRTRRSGTLAYRCAPVADDHPLRQDSVRTEGTGPGGGTSLAGWAGQCARVEQSAAAAKGEKRMPVDAEPSAAGN